MALPLEAGGRARTVPLNKFGGNSLSAPSFHSQCAYTNFLLHKKPRAAGKQSPQGWICVETPLLSTLKCGKAGIGRAQGCVDVDKAGKGIKEAAGLEMGLGETPGQPWELL